MQPILSHRTARRLLCAGALLFAGLSSASAQGAPKASGSGLVAPAEVVLYIHSDLERTDFIPPLVCALRRVLTAPVSTQSLKLPLGPELRATPKSIGRLAGLRGQGACVLASPQSLDGLDRRSPAFCQEDREALVAVGVLKSTENGEGKDCMGISLWKADARRSSRAVRRGQPVDRHV
jgi:hypothetical protein